MVWPLKLHMVFSMCLRMTVSMRISEQGSPKSTDVETIRYTIADGDGDISSATLTINVIEVSRTQNDASDYGAHKGNNIQLVVNLLIVQTIQMAHKSLVNLILQMKFCW